MAFAPGLFSRGGGGRCGRGISSRRWSHNSREDLDASRPVSNTYTPASSLISQGLQCPAPLQPRNSHLGPSFPLTNSPVKSVNRTLFCGQFSITDGDKELCPYQCAALVHFWTRGTALWSSQCSRWHPLGLQCPELPGSHR